MAIRVLKKCRMTSGGPGMYRRLFALDSEADVSGLPTNTEGRSGYGPTACDSIAVVIGKGEGLRVFMLGGDGQWVEV